MNVVVIGGRANNSGLYHLAMDGNSNLLTYTQRWHDTWEIVGSAATLVAVVIALVIALVEGRGRARAQSAELERLRSERDEARSERRATENVANQRAREAQARQVVIWAEIQRENSVLLLDVRTVNYSDAPVFAATVYAPEREPRSETDHVIRVGKTVGTLIPRVEHVDTARVTLAAGKDSPGSGASEDQPRQFEVGDLDPVLPHVHVVFRDAHGTWWSRAGDGSLEEVEPWAPGMPRDAVDAHNPWSINT